MSKKHNNPRKLSVKSQEYKSQIEIATQTLERNIGFINNCDNKTSIVLAVVGVLLTIILTSDALKKIYEIIKTCIAQKTCCCILYLIFLFFSVGIMLYGILCLGSVLIAKTAEANRDFSNNNSHIASAKYSKYNRGLKWSVGGFALFVTMLIVGVCLY